MNEYYRHQIDANIEVEEVNDSCDTERSVAGSCETVPTPWGNKYIIRLYSKATSPETLFSIIQKREQRMQARKERGYDSELLIAQKVITSHVKELIGQATLHNYKTNYQAATLAHEIQHVWQQEKGDSNFIEQAYSMFFSSDIRSGKLGENNQEKILRTHNIALIYKGLNESDALITGILACDNRNIQEVLLLENILSAFCLFDQAQSRGSKIIGHLQIAIEIDQPFRWMINIPDGEYLYSYLVNVLEDPFIFKKIRKKEVDKAELIHNAKVKLIEISNDPKTYVARVLASDFLENVRDASRKETYRAYSLVHS